MEIHVGAFPIQNEHQIRQRAKDGAIPGFRVPQRGFGPLSPGALNQQAADQHHLRTNEQAAADHVATIALEQRQSKLRFQRGNDSADRGLSEAHARCSGCHAP